MEFKDKLDEIIFLKDKFRQQESIPALSLQW